MEAKFSLRRFSRYTRVTDLISSPCHMLKPSSSNFNTFCQFDYHSKPYVCDPSGYLTLSNTAVFDFQNLEKLILSGSLSRTEIEMLDRVISPLNVSSCFCQYTKSCYVARFRIAIIVVPYTNVESLKKCGLSSNENLLYTWSQIALIYSEELARHWMKDCRADLLLVYIGAFGAESARRAYIVPIYRNQLDYLSQHSKPFTVASRYNIYGAIDQYLITVRKLISTGRQITRPSIPSWAIFVSVGFIALAISSVYIANCLTNRSRGAYWQCRRTNGTKIRLANERWRAGFGGGLMMQNNANSKSSMMFKQFGGRRTKQSDTTRKI